LADTLFTQDSVLVDSDVSSFPEMLLNYWPSSSTFSPSMLEATQSRCSQLTRTTHPTQRWSTLHLHLASFCPQLHTRPSSRLVCNFFPKIFLSWQSSLCHQWRLRLRRDLLLGRPRQGSLSPRRSPPDRPRTNHTTCQSTRYRLGHRLQPLRDRTLRLHQRHSYNPRLNLRARPQKSVFLGSCIFDLFNCSHNF
jgi:hypothetical protein